MMLREPTRDTGGQPKPTVRSRHVTADVWVPKPVEIAPAADERSKDLARQFFEDALDKVSRPVKGKYAGSLPSSEEFIRDKHREAELEDR